MDSETPYLVKSLKFKLKKSQPLRQESVSSAEPKIQ